MRDVGATERGLDAALGSNYIVVMKATLVRIGNSRGIRLPKPVIEQCGFEDEVEMEVHHHELVIRSSSLPRAGWALGASTQPSRSCRRKAL